MNKYTKHKNYITGYTFDNQKFIIDVEDYDKIKAYQWYVKDNGYVFSSKTKTHGSIYLHKLILNFPTEHIDHINKDKLDNRKSNLRICKQYQNNRNKNKMTTRTCSTDYIGVNKYSTCRYSKRKQRIITYTYYRAYIRIDNKHIHIGNYDNLEDALIARLKAEYKYFGEYAPQKELFAKYKIYVDK